MAQKLWRVVRSCVELGMRNPIQQIHDQGAGGNCNVVKEIIYPLGAEINVRKVWHRVLFAVPAAGRCGSCTLPCECPPLSPGETTRVMSCSN